MILFEDKSIIVCHKPAGFPVQSARISRQDMVSLLNNHLAETAGDNGTLKERPQVYVVHRLDQPVEGVIVFAKTKKAAAHLTKQMNEGSVKKIYRAVCCADSQENCGNSQECCTHSAGFVRLVNYLVKDGRTNTSNISEKENKKAKRAELSYRIIHQIKLPVSDADRRLLLTEIELETGRHHQIRVQMAAAGLPLYGDRKYNTKWREFVVDGEKRSIEADNKEVLALCAAEYRFLHPETGEKLSFRVSPAGAVFGMFDSSE